MILVAGATGSVGSHVVRELRDRGVGVRAFVRDAAKAAERLGDGVELALGDYADPPSVRRALESVEGVFLACPNHPGQVEDESGVIDVAAEANVRRIVKLSAMGAEVGSSLTFWDWQGRIEQHLGRSGVPAVLLRPTFYMSNLLASAEQVRSQGMLFAPAGGAKVAMIDPRDVAAVAAVALTTEGHEGQAYVLTGPEAITFEHVAEALSAVTGGRVEFIDIPYDAARQGMVAAGTPEWLAEQLVVLFEKLRQGAAEQTTDTVLALTGHGPRTFTEFAHDHAALFSA